GIGTLCSTTVNFPAYKSTIPLLNMPCTMRDAAHVARQLGQHYLWIDALCILQNSKEDWEQHASCMHTIFANAWLVISVDATSDCSSGFLSSR
ncbi:HET-domain-containing protein, partial [Zopfia rhizophila CBS 207.26]